jgi:hypothetical protein
MSFESEQALQRELNSGEKLLWTGQPSLGLRLRPSDALMIPFSLMWGGFAVFWEYSVVQGGAPAFFMLWGIPFVAIGLYMIIGRFFVDAALRARTHYGLTDQRVLIIHGLFSREVKSLTLSGLTDISLQERNDRTGTITFGAQGGVPRWFATSGWPGMNKQLAPAFEMIENARSVYTRIREAQQSSRLRVGA